MLSQLGNSVSGPSGATGSTGAAGATGPTGATGATGSVASASYPAYIDGSDNLHVLYDNSSIQLNGSNQLYNASTRVFTETVGFYFFDPAASTTYYFGPLMYNLYPSSGPQTVSGRRISREAYSDTLVGASLTVINATGSSSDGSGESNTFSIFQNGTTSTTLFTTVSLANADPLNTYSTTSLSQPFSAGDYWEIKWVTPAFATDPEDISLQITLYFKPK